MTVVRTDLTTVQDVSLVQAKQFAAEAVRAVFDAQGSNYVPTVEVSVDPVTDLTYDLQFLDGDADVSAPYTFTADYVTDPLRILATSTIVAVYAFGAWDGVNGGDFNAGNLGTSEIASHGDGTITTAGNNSGTVVMVVWADAA